MITRRDFLKLAVLGAGAVALRPYKVSALPEFPQSDRLGRIAVGKMDVYARPNGNDTPIGALYEDQVIPWLREVVGSMSGRTSQRFVETLLGLYAIDRLWNLAEPVDRY